MTAHVNAAGQSFGSAALKSALLNTALNAGIFLAVSVALQTTVKAIDDYIHRNEILLEKAGEADSRINALNENYKSHKKTVEELGASYDKLSQGVDTATNQNISLSDEEYAEYLRITNELAETFPQLRTTVDENENAILHFSHQTKSAAENLDDLLASEQQIANYKISQELPDLFGGVSVKADELEAAKQKYDALSASASKYEENLARLDMTASDDVFSLQTDNSQAGIAYYSALSSAVQQFTNTLPAAQKEFFDLTQMVETNDAGISTIHFNLSSLDEGQKGELQKIIDKELGSVRGALNDQVGNFEIELNDAQSRFDVSWNDFRSNLIKAMQSQATYQGLDDTSKLLADVLVGNLPSEIESQMDSDKPYQWINDNIFSQLSKIDDAQLLSEFQNKIQKLLSFEDGDIDVVTYGKELQKWLNDNQLLIDLTPILANEQEAKQSLNDSINGIVKNSSGVIDLAELIKLQEYTKDFNEAQIQAWTKATSGIQGAQNAIDAYEKALKSPGLLSPPVTFDPAAFAENIEALSSLQSFYNDFYNHVKDGTDFTFDISEIESLREAFGATCEEFENFEKLATSSATSAEELQESFDTLATQYVISSLDGLNESTREQIISQLELQGITGSSELLTEDLASAYGILADSGYTLSDATNTAYWSLLDEANASEVTKGSLYALAAAEIAYNSTGLNVQDKISKLGQLALAYGDTATAAIAQVAADRVAMGHGDYESVYADMMASANRAAQTSTLKIGQASTNTSGGKSGSGAGARKETAQEFNWIEKAIENVEDEISRLDKIADSSFSSVSEKNAALRNEIEKINEEIGIQQQAYAQYMAKADAVGLSDTYQNLVQNGAVNIEEISDENLKEAISDYTEWYKKAKDTQDKIDDLHNDAKEKHVEGYELELEELERLRDDQTMTEREYLDELLVLYEKYYADQTAFASQAKEAKLNYLQEEKSYLETVANAAVSLLDNEIDALEADKDSAREKYEKQIEGIDLVIEERQKEIEVIQDQIDALTEENEEIDRQQRLQKAQYDQQRAFNQKTQFTYKDGQMSYDIDYSALKDADSSVREAQKDIAIANLQKQIDSIQDGIDELDIQKEKLKELAEESDAYFDSKIQNLQNYQNQWKNSLALEEQAAAIENLKAMFGEDAIAQILSGNTQLLTTWAQEYADTMAAIDLVNMNTVGAITAEWAKLAGISIDMEHARELSDLPVGELSARAESLGITMQNTQDRVNGVITELNNLALQVSSYEIPPINTEQFMASLNMDENSGVFVQLNAFVAKFREICESIPSIWNNTMASMNGQGGAPGESAENDSLFSPLIGAMDSTKTAIDSKLLEYQKSWTNFNEQLGKIIGIDSGSSGSPDGGPGSAQKGGNLTKSPEDGGQKESGDGSIIGTIEAGGAAITQSFNETWIPGIESFALRVDEICLSVCSMVADMANEIIDMVNAALKALKELAAQNTGAYKIDKVSSSYSPHSITSSNASGTSSSAAGRGAITHSQESLVNELGNEMLVRDGVLYEIQGGAQKISLKKGDVIFNHKQTREIKKYNRVKSGGGRGRLIGAFAAGTVITPGGHILTALSDAHPVMRMQKQFDDFVKKAGGMDILSANTLIAHSRQMENMGKQITNANIVNNTASHRPSVTTGDIHITCPGVTSQQVARQVGVELNHMFHGLHLDAEQHSRMR